jgi:hypothetical protein
VNSAPSRHNNHADATATAVISSAGRVQPTIKGGWTTASTINTCNAVAIDEQSAATAMSRVWVGIARILSPIAPMVAALETKPPKNPASGRPRPGPSQRSAICPRPLIASTSNVSCPTRRGLTTPSPSTARSGSKGSSTSAAAASSIMSSTSRSVSVRLTKRCNASRSSSVSATTTPMAAANIGCTVA